MAMLRISTIGGASGTTLKVEGKLVAPWVEELQRACAGVDVPPDRLTLNLAGVTFVDAAGTRLLHELLERKVAIAPCSGFVTALLRRTAS
jgi:hypothetical protein